MEQMNSSSAFYNSVCEYERVKREKIEDLLTDADFFAWLDLFTQEYEGFDDGRWKHHHNEISEEDRTNIERLNFLYEAIRLWTEKNKIYPNLREYAEFYEVRIGNTGYEIGIDTSNGLSYFCNRVEEMPRFIDFDDILADKRAENVRQRIDALMHLESAILKLRNLDISKHIVHTKVEDIIAKVYTKDI